MTPTPPLPDHFERVVPVPPAAVFAATEALWMKRSMLPEHSEEIVREVLAAAWPAISVAFDEEQR